MNIDEVKRAYLYRILVALGGLAVIYGLVTADQLVNWLLVGAAILGLGGNTLASANTSTDKNKPKTLS